MDFETSATVQEATICTKTGLLARSSCPSITEYFAVSDLRPSVARATTPRRPQHRRRPEPLLQHQLRRQPRHRRRHRRKLRLRPKHLPIRLLIHQKLPTHRIPLMHRQNRIPRRRHRKYSRSPKRAALPNSFSVSSMHKKPALWHMPAGPGFSILLFPSESISQSAFLLRRRYQHRFQGKRVRSGYLCMR